MRPNQGRGDRAAYRRAHRWRKKPLRTVRAWAWKNGAMRAVRVKLVKPVDDAMRHWITNEELLNALQDTWK